MVPFFLPVHSNCWRYVGLKAVVRTFMPVFCEDVKVMVGPGTGEVVTKGMGKELFEGYPLP